MANDLDLVLDYLDITTFRGNKFKGIELSNKNLTNCDFFYSSFSDTSLTNNDFSDSDFKEVSFNEINISNCKFNNCKMNMSNMYGTTFLDTEFEKTDLSNVFLTNTKHTNSTFNNTIFYNTVLSQATFENSKFIDFSFENCEFQETNFTNSAIVNLTFNDKYYSNITFENCNIENIDFSNINLENLKFLACTFTNVKFNNSLLKNIDFSNSNFNNTNFEKIKLDNTLFNDIVVNDTKFLECDLNNTILPSEIEITETNNDKLHSNQAEADTTTNEIDKFKDLINSFRKNSETNINNTEKDNLANSISNPINKTKVYDVYRSINMMESLDKIKSMLDNTENIDETFKIDFLVDGYAQSESTLLFYCCLGPDFAKIKTTFKSNNKIYDYQLELIKLILTYNPKLNFKAKFKLLDKKYIDGVEKEEFSILEAAIQGDFFYERFDITEYLLKNTNIDIALPTGNFNERIEDFLTTRVSLNITDEEIITVFELIKKYRNNSLNLNKHNEHTITKTNDFIDTIKVTNNGLVTDYSINDINENGSTSNIAIPLLGAAQHCRYKLVEYLIDEGADPFAIGSDNNTNGIHLAIAKWATHSSESRINTIKVFLEAGLDINEENLEGFTPLMSACSVGALEVVNFLIKNGAIVNYTSSNGFTPILFAADSSSDYQYTHCYEANEDVQIKMIKLLLDNGASINNEDNQSATPLAISIISNYNKTAKYLLSIGANPNTLIEYFDGRAINHLMLSVYLGNYEIAHEILTKTNIDVNYLDNDNNNVLIFLALSNNSKGQVELYKILKEKYNVEYVKNNDDETPLFFAANKSYELTKYILELNDDDFYNDQKIQSTVLAVACGINAVYSEDFRLEERKKIIELLVNTKVYDNNFEFKKMLYDELKNSENYGFIEIKEIINYLKSINFVFEESNVNKVNKIRN